MISHKYMTKIVGVMVAAAVALCFLAMLFSQRIVETLGGNVVVLQYPTKLFDTDTPMEIDIRMGEGEWEDMLENAMAEEYYACDVVVNGEKIDHVGIRPKGNTSLSSIAMDPDTDRFSLKLEFDHYEKGQTCFGLDKLILNNNYADATNMKEALVYDMYQYLGVDASLYNYAKISVNGEYRGVYLALEAVEESFLVRNFGTKDGELYKPDSMRMGGGPDGGDFGGRPPQDEEGTDFAQKEPPWERGENPGEAFHDRGDRKPSDMGKMPGGGNGANLNYTDDDLDSYSDIWEGEVTGTGSKDHRKVVKALKNIDAGTELETYLDVDNILKYMAVHVFCVNLDSLSGNMAHNYYLYEQDGMLNMFPWDYNLSFGGMNMGAESSASETVNDAIDTPFQGTDFFDALLENETYLAEYHEYLRKLAEEYVYGGRFEEAYRRIRGQIDGLVETDPTALYSYEEYDAGAQMLYRTVLLRAESVRGQLNGVIPSTDEGQKADDAMLVDASEIDIEVMGVMRGKGGTGREEQHGRRDAKSVEKNEGLGYTEQ